MHRPHPCRTAAAAFIAATLTAPIPSAAQMSLAKARLDAADHVPAEFKDARLMVAVGGKPVRLRARLLILAGTNCPARDDDDAPPCTDGRGLHGELRLTGFLLERPSATAPIDTVWLIRDKEVWKTSNLHMRDDGIVEFEGGPAWPPLEPVLAVIKLRDNAERLIDLDAMTIFVQR